MACRAKARRACCVVCARIVAEIAATEAVALQFRSPEMKIRPATETDRDAIWNIFHEVVADGDTYSLDPNISREDALAYWFAAGTHTYVAEQPAIGIAGTYILRPNQSGGGSHVANAGFMVSASARGQGIGRAMADHCLHEASRLGFRAMQFNYVISTNTAAIRLWQDLGFEIVGTLASAFRHPDKGYVDVYVMYRSLLER
jgi:ribosomal protein S18 acetylase RimI-like enzyme